MIDLGNKRKDWIKAHVRNQVSQMNCSLINELSAFSEILSRQESKYRVMKYSS